MMRFIIPIIFLGITGTLFVVYTNPIYNDVLESRLKVASFDTALNNSKKFEIARDTLTAKYNSVTLENREKIKKFLPDNVDNIRLILEIEQIALPHGMILKDVKYNSTQINTTSEATSTKGAVVKGGSSSKTAKDYGVFDLEFSTSGTYDKFIDFTKDLESNLRMVDISSVTFSSNSGSTGSSSKTTTSSEVYQYNFKIKTYFLKN